VNLRPRQIQARVMVGASQVTDFLHVRVENSVSQPYPKATIVAPRTYGYYDDPVTVELGATPGNGLVMRFNGYRRDVNPSLSPAAVSIDAVGQLARAAEHYNHDDPFYFGGLTVADLVPSATNGLATAAQIRAAVLDRVGIVYDPANIGSTGRLYGALWTEFLWKSGTPSADDLMSNPFAFSRAGESALDYLHRYDQIEAIWNGITDTGAMGGFYRTVENLDGRIFVVLMGGRPRTAPDIDPASGQQMIWEEGLNILDGQAQRQYPGGSHVLVVGADWGQAIAGANVGGPMHFDAAIDAGTIILATDNVYDQSPPSSSMIEWDTAANAQTNGFGMDCQTVAYARLLEVARETVTANLETAEDWVCGPTQTHVLQGPGGQGTPDYTQPRPWPRLLTGEKLWCQGVVYDLGLTADGAPDFTLSVQLLGGGSPDDTFAAIPTG
jgi:hypothetical protein